MNMSPLSSSYLKKIKHILLVILIIIALSFLVMILIDFFIFKKVFVSLDEGFTTLDIGKGTNIPSTRWSKTTILSFIQFQKTKNPLLIFDMDVVQQNASESEATELLTRGMWPWSPVTQQIYKDMIVRDINRQINPKDSMEKDRSIYCEAIIKNLLAMKAPEGKFLLHGVLVRNRSRTGGNVADSSGEGTYGVESGLISQKQDLIRCNGPSGMQRISYTGAYDGITGVRIKTVENLNYVDLPDIVPGFSFLDSPCNPCSALSDDPLNKYRCPFSIARENGNGGYYEGVGALSDIWKVLWGFGNYFVSSEVQVPSHFAAFRVNS
jgi:hypothetical protein